MSDIKIGVVGQIKQGDDAGCFVKVVDDSNRTGGYLVLTSKDETFDKVYDDWVQDKNTLEKYFEESNWVISWKA